MPPFQILLWLPPAERRESRTPRSDAAQPPYALKWGDVRMIESCSTAVLGGDRAILSLGLLGPSRQYQTIEATGLCSRLGSPIGTGEL